MSFRKRDTYINRPVPDLASYRALFLYARCVGNEFLSLLRLFLRFFFQGQPDQRDPTIFKSGMTCTGSPGFHLGAGRIGIVPSLALGETGSRMMGPWGGLISVLERTVLSVSKQARMTDVPRYFLRLSAIAAPPEHYCTPCASQISRAWGFRLIPDSNEGFQAYYYRRTIHNW